MDLGAFLWDSYYIEAGKENFYIKCFESGQWIRCKSEFMIDEKQNICKIFIESGTIELNENRSIQVNTERVNPFNHPRVVLHQFELAEQFIRCLIGKFKAGWWTSTRTFIFQLDYAPDGGFTDIELRAIRDSLEHSGAKEVYIIKPDISVSERKVDDLYQEISKQRFSRKKKLNPEWRSLIF